MSVCTWCAWQKYGVVGGLPVVPIPFSLVLGRAGLQSIRAKLGRQKNHILRPTDMFTPTNKI